MFDQISGVELILFAGCLLVAVYMFAALKFPVLRFIFSLRSGVASAAGVGQQQNQQIGQVLGLVLCPLIGIIALGAAANIAWGWKSDADSDVRLAESNAQQQQIDQEQLGIVLNDWVIEGVYFDRSRQYGVSDEGLMAVQAFWGKLRQEVDSPEVIASSREERDLKQALLIRLKPADGSVGIAEVALLFDQDIVSVTHSMKSNRIVSQGFQWVLPASVDNDLKALSALERVDLRAKEREERRLANEEQRRLNHYQEKTFVGTPSWEIHDKIMALPEDQRRAMKDQFIGMVFDWECEVLSISEASGVVVYRLSQSRPNAGRSWSLLCEVPLAEAGVWPTESRNAFVRIKGAITSFEQGIQVKVDEVQPLLP